MSTAEIGYTPDDLLTMRDGDNFELVDGQLVERTTSQESSWIAGEVYARVREIARRNKLGWSFPEGTMPFHTN